jgi:hypothetical protein
MTKQLKALSCGVGLVLILAFSFFMSARSAETRHKVFFGVDQTAMGQYRAFADICFYFFTKGDNVLAAKCSRALERSWDRSEAAELQAGKPHNELFKQIDAAMDKFVLPVEFYEEKMPDRAAVETAYKSYLDVLSKADEVIADSREH